MITMEKLISSTNEGTDLARVAWIIAMAAVAIHFETWWIALLGILAF